MISQRIEELSAQHGSLRAAARALQLDVSYLSRLKDGAKTNPSTKVLKKLGLRRIVEIRYVRAESHKGG